MAASGATTPERDARRGVQCLTRQHDSALGADRGRRGRADVCDNSASALAPAIVGIRGWVTGGEPHTCAMPKPACALGMQAQADGALITPAGRAVPRPMCATLLRDTPKGSQAAPRVRFRQPGCTQSAIRPARPWQFPRQGQAGFSGCRASSSPRSCSWRCYSSQGGATARLDRSGGRMGLIVHPQTPHFIPLDGWTQVTFAGHNQLRAGANMLDDVQVEHGIC